MVSWPLKDGPFKSQSCPVGVSQDEAGLSVFSRWHKFWIRKAGCLPLESCLRGVGYYPPLLESVMKTVFFSLLLLPFLFTLSTSGVFFSTCYEVSLFEGTRLLMRQPVTLDTVHAQTLSVTRQTAYVKGLSVTTMADGTVLKDQTQGKVDTGSEVTLTPTRAGLSVRVTRTTLEALEPVEVAGMGTFVQPSTALQKETVQLGGTPGLVAIQLPAKNQDALAVIINPAPEALEW